MAMTLGGRAAENLVFGRISTGAENDLSRVTRLAFDQIRIYGMNAVVGPLSFPPAPGEEHQSQFYKKPYSRQLHSLIDHVSLMSAFSYNYELCGIIRQLIAGGFQNSYKCLRES